MHSTFGRGWRAGPAGTPGSWVLRGTWDVQAVFQVLSVSANENRARVLGHGELTEAEELSGVKWPS